MTLASAASSRLLRDTTLIILSTVTVLQLLRVADNVIFCAFFFAFIVHHSLLQALHLPVPLVSDPRCAFRPLLDHPPFLCSSSSLLSYLLQSRGSGAGY